MLLVEHEAHRGELERRIHDVTRSHEYVANGRRRPVIGGQQAVVPQFLAGFQGSRQSPGFVSLHCFEVYYVVAAKLDLQPGTGGYAEREIDGK